MATNSARSALLAFMDHIDTTQATTGAEWHFTVSMPGYQVLSVQRVKDKQATASPNIVGGNQDTEALIAVEGTPAAEFPNRRTTRSSCRVSNDLGRR
ncbi:hypothetical protein MRB53_038858 [Persea americana]|nr:hypothetical protein MRB53_038858 [Persea americana]